MKSYSEIALASTRLLNELKVEFSDESGQRIRSFLPQNTCPDCKIGKLRQINGKYGIFIGCDKYPNCHYTRSV